MHGNISKRVVGGEIRSPLPSYSVFWCVLSYPYPFSSSSCLFNGPPLSALEEDEEEDAAAKKGRYFPCDLGKRRRGGGGVGEEGGAKSDKVPFPFLGSTSAKKKEIGGSINR